METGFQPHNLGLDLPGAEIENYGVLQMNIKKFPVD